MERGHQIDIRNVAFFRHDYDDEHADLRHLYEQAKLDQWNAATDIDWAQPLDSDGGLIADDLVDIYGTTFWDRSEPRRASRGQPRGRALAPVDADGGRAWRDAGVQSAGRKRAGPGRKIIPGDQVVDEGRHNEVLHRYMGLRLEGRNYPLANNVKEIFDTLLGTGAWYLKTIGLQLVAETFAVSLFRMLAELSKNAVLRQVCRRILQDEARHMGFGMLSLPAVVAEASAAERREMEDFAVWALNRTLRGIFPRAAYEEMGFSPERDRTDPAIAPRAGGGGEEPHSANISAATFTPGWFAISRKVGVLSDRVAPDLEALGISLAAA